MTMPANQQIWFRGAVVLLIVGCFQCVFSCKTEKKTPSKKTSGVTVRFQDQTYDELLLFPRRLIAVVQCVDVDFVERGTRSERVIIDTKVIAAGEESAKESLQLTRYTQNDSLLTVGQTYLVAAYDDGAWQPAWTLVEWIPVSPEAAQSALEAVTEALQRRAAESEH
jgi:hypothetical protein